MRDIVEVIGRRLNLPAEAAPDEAFGPLAGVFSTGCDEAPHSLSSRGVATCA